MNVTTKIEHEWQADAVIAAAKAKGWVYLTEYAFSLDRKYPGKRALKPGHFGFWHDRTAALAESVVSFGAFLDAIPERKPKLMIGGHEVEVVGVHIENILCIGSATVTQEQWEAAGKLAGWV